MDNSRGKILWVDDEIDHLKPHILFLEDKGFSISTASNGADAVTLIKESNFQLILMDQFMPGQDGIQTIKQFSELRPNLPVIMITKSEEEWLMDEAISQKISQFLKMKAELDALKEDMRLNSLWMEIKEKSLPHTLINRNLLNIRHWQLNI